MSSGMDSTNGGLHSRTGQDWIGIDPSALKRMAEVLQQGKESHKDSDGSNWRKLPVNVHLDHALYHINEYRIGDQLEDHLGHALTRMMMAVAVQR